MRLFISVRLKNVRKRLVFRHFQDVFSKSINLKWPNESIFIFQILTELEYSGVGQNKEQSATMFAHLVSNASQLIKPYIDTILKVYMRCFARFGTIYTKTWITAMEEFYF